MKCQPNHLTSGANNPLIQNSMGVRSGQKKQSFIITFSTSEGHEGLLHRIIVTLQQKSHGSWL